MDQKRINTICLIFLSFFALTIGLVYTKTVMLPLFLALLLYTSTVPFIEYSCEKFKAPKGLSVLFLALIFILLLSFLVLFSVNSIETFIASADNYKEKLFIFIENIVQLGRPLGFEFDEQNVIAQIKSLPIFSMAKLFTGSLLSIVSTSSLVLIFYLFLLFSETQQNETNSKNLLFHQVQVSISKYLTTKLITSFTTASLVFLILFFFKVELAFLFGVLTFLFNFIPSIGSIIATVLPVPIVILNYGGSWEAFIILGSCGFIQFLIGNIIEPKFMGEGLDLHPITIMVFLLFWGLVWGIPGMFLSVPITVFLKVVLYKVEITRPLAELFAGRVDNS